MAKGLIARVREKSALKAAEYRVRAQAQATVLHDRAVALHARGQIDEAIAAFDELVAHFGSSQDLSLQVLTANALFAKGTILQSLQQPAPAIEVYNALLARCGIAEEPPLMEAVAKAMQNKGAALNELGRHAEAIKLYDELEDRIGSSTDPTLGGIIDRNRLNRRLVTHNQVIDQFERISDPSLNERVAAATAFLERGAIWAEMPKAAGNEVAIENYNQVVARFGGADELPLRERVARALFNKAIALHELGRNDDALTSFDELVAFCGNAPELPLQEQAARGLSNKGIMARSAEEAIAVSDELAARFGTSREPTLRERVVQAFVNKGNHLGKLGRLEEAITAYEDVQVRLSNIAELRPDERLSLAMALGNKGRTLSWLGRYEEEIAAYDELVVRFRDATEAPVRDQVASALLNKGIRLEVTGHLPEAIVSFREALASKPYYAPAERSLERALAAFDKSQAEQEVELLEAPESDTQKGELVSDFPGYTDETPSPEAAAPWLLWMRDAFAKIDELTALLPDEKREAYRAKARADFAAAAGITAPADETVREAAGHAAAEPQPPETPSKPSKVESVFGDISGFRTKAHTRRNYSPDVVNDPGVIEAAKTIVNGHRHTPINTLTSEEAERLRTARAILRRHERKAPHP